MRQHTTSTLRFVQPVTPTVDVVAFVGTRPEAIKLAPVVLAARRQEAGEIPGLMMRLATTGQHEEVVRRALAVFELEVDHRLQCDRLTGSLHELFGVLVAQMGAFLASQPPAAVIVQGDTSSAAAGALAAFYQRVPVVHLEAGLTTRSLHSPFPEEGHRRLISQLASLHLAPTGGAAANLVARGVEVDRIVVTGNTVVDALSMVLARPPTAVPPDLSQAMERAARAKGKVVTVTAHRRESWGEPMAQIASALRTLVGGSPDVHVMVVVHPNQRVADDMRDRLAGTDRVTCLPPLEYDAFVHLLSSSAVVLTDSGGLQEELPSLRVPVVVLRDETERQEAIEAGWSVLSGTDPRRIVELTQHALDHSNRFQGLANPFGDGRSAERVVLAIEWFLGRGTRPDDYSPAARA